MSDSPVERRMYDDLAWLWPIINPRDIYESEAAAFWEVIREHSRIPVKSVLHLGCGGGLHDATLKQYVGITAVDISESMLDLAKRENPDVHYLTGDMRTIRFPEPFDAVIIFDSLAYAYSEADLRAAFDTAYANLKPGGLFITYKSYDPETFEQNEVYFTSGAEGDLEVTFIGNEYDPDTSDTTFDYTSVYLIRRNGQLSIETDCHPIGIFTLSMWLDAMKDAGFDVEILDGTLEDGRPVFICTKPAT